MDEQTLRSILTCKICTKLLRDATLLPCGHAFCLKCLSLPAPPPPPPSAAQSPDSSSSGSDSHHSPQLTCRTCSKTTEQAVGQLVACVPLRELTDALEGSPGKAGLAEPPVTKCCEGEVQMNIYCTQCRLDMCENCWDSSHLGHSVIPSRRSKIPRLKEILPKIDQMTSQIDSKIAAYQKSIGDCHLLLKNLTETLGSLQQLKASGEQIDKSELQSWSESPKGDEPESARKAIQFSQAYESLVSVRADDIPNFDPKYLRTSVTITLDVTGVSKLKPGVCHYSEAKTVNGIAWRIFIKGKAGAAALAADVSSRSEDGGCELVGAFLDGGLHAWAAGESCKVVWEMQLVRLAQPASPGKRQQFQHRFPCRPPNSAFGCVDFISAADLANPDKHYVLNDSIRLLCQLSADPPRHDTHT